MDNDILNYGPWPYLMLAIIVAAIAVVVYMKRSAVQKKLDEIGDDMKATKSKIEDKLK
jgi:hypothetical protein